MCRAGANRAWYESFFRRNAFSMYRVILATGLLKQMKITIKRTTRSRNHLFYTFSFFGFCNRKSLKHIAAVSIHVVLDYCFDARVPYLPTYPSIHLLAPEWHPLLHPFIHTYIHSTSTLILNRASASRASIHPPIHPSIQSGK